jgi:hypothetical protein
MALFKCSKNNDYDIVTEESSNREQGGKKYTLRNGQVLYFSPNQIPVPCTNDEECRSCNGTGAWAYMNEIDPRVIPLGVIQAENA